MAGKNKITYHNPDGVEFGTVIFDIDVEDITEPFRKDFEDSIADEDYFEKFCLYMTLFNNFVCEKGESFPRRVSCIDTTFDFFFVLLHVAMDYQEETIKNIEPFFWFWIDWLNENVDVLDRIQGKRFPGHEASRLFDVTLKNILESDDE